MMGVEDLLSAEVSRIFSKVNEEEAARIARALGESGRRAAVSSPDEILADAVSVGKQLRLMLEASAGGRGNTEAHWDNPIPGPANSEEEPDGAAEAAERLANGSREE